MDASLRSAGQPIPEIIKNYYHFDFIIEGMNHEFPDHSARGKI